MTVEELITFIFEGRQHIVCEVLARWMISYGPFRDFCYRYRTKIRRKVRKARGDEALKDVGYELEIALLVLLDGRCLVEYEKYGSNNAGPDFSATLDLVEFNLEVKRLREATLGIRFDDWTSEIRQRIQTIPSSLVVSFSIPTWDHALDLVPRLEAALDDVYGYIESIIHARREQMTIDAIEEYPIPGFIDELELQISNPASRQGQVLTAYTTYWKPIFYTQKELRNIGDTIFDKLHQMIPNSINVLVISATSSTHERENLIEAINSINGQISQHNEEFFKKKGFVRIQDFLDQVRNLSGILFKSSWVDSKGNPTNLLWCNERADRTISENIAAFLSQLGINSRNLSRNQ